MENVSSPQATKNIIFILPEGDDELSMSVSEVGKGQIFLEFQKMGRAHGMGLPVSQLYVMMKHYFETNETAKASYDPETGNPFILI